MIPFFIDRALSIPSWPTPNLAMTPPMGKDSYRRLRYASTPTTAANARFSRIASERENSSGAAGYPGITKEALLEMHRQVGIAKPAKDGLMHRGLMIRHLVIPNNVGGSKEVIKWIAENLPKDTYLNIMSQYRPMYKAFEYPEISRRITRQEYEEVVGYARGLGLTSLEVQGY